MTQETQSIPDETGESAITIVFEKNLDDMTANTLQKAIGYLSMLHLQKDGVSVTNEPGCR